MVETFDKAKLRRQMAKYRFKYAGTILGNFLLFKDKQDGSPADIVIGLETDSEGAIAFSWNYPQIYVHIPKYSGEEMAAIAAQTVHDLTREYLYTKSKSS